MARWRPVEQILGLLPRKNIKGERERQEALPFQWTAGNEDIRLPLARSQSIPFSQLNLVFQHKQILLFYM